MSDSTRLQRVNRLLQRELGNMFQQDGTNIYGNLITVTAVKVSRDLSVARVNLSIFPEKDKAGVLKKVQSNGKEIRYRLGQKIGQQLRVIPELSFVIDDTLDYVENIEHLLEEDKKRMSEQQQTAEE